MIDVIYTLEQVLDPKNKVRKSAHFEDDIKDVVSRTLEVNAALKKTGYTATVEIGIEEHYSGTPNVVRNVAEMYTVIPIDKKYKIAIPKKRNYGSVKNTYSLNLASADLRTWYTKLPYITKHSDFSHLLKHVDVPNNIGVFTESKILAWIKYWKTCISIVETKSAELVKDVEKFLKRLNDKKLLGNFKSKSDPRTGAITGFIELVQNGIEYEAQVLESGFISEKIKLHHSVSSNLDNFLTLSNNKFDGTK